MIKETIQSIKWAKRMDFVRTLKKEIKAFMPEADVTEQVEDSTISLWFDYHKWVMEEDKLLAKVQSKYPNAYKNDTFIYIPIDIPFEFEISTEEIKDYLIDSISRQNELIERAIEHREKLKEAIKSL